MAENGNGCAARVMCGWVDMSTKPLLREDEVSDGINIIVDDRFCAMFPMEYRAQVEHLIRVVNLAVKQKLEERR
jgi:hypothetical protein